MFPPATLHVIDRLVIALMTIVRAVAPGATTASTHTLPEAAAETLFFRLAQLVTHLIRISAFGVRAPAKSKPKPTTPAPKAPPQAARPSQPIAAARLPRRPGWLLAALPEIAPSVAAEISALLADPATAILLDRAPSLHRTLRPLLRGLGLDAARPIATPPRPPSPSTKPPGAPPPSPAPPRPRKLPPPATASNLVLPDSKSSHALIVPVSQRISSVPASTTTSGPTASAR